MTKNNKKLLASFGLFALALPIVAIASSEILISRDKQGRIYKDVKKVPPVNVGLLMGVTKRLRNGSPNPFYFSRLNATVELFKAGKIKNVLISGDNSDSKFNEPEALKLDLINKGIPKDNIYVDYGGARSKDSLLRAREVFGQEKFIIISSHFHNERCLYIADKYHIEAIAFDAKEVPVLHGGFGAAVRERISRIKAMTSSICCSKRPPHFDGQKITIK